MAVSASLIDPNNLQAIESFEKSFYTAYRNIEQQKLIRQIWVWDDKEERIALRCPLESSTIFAWLENGIPSFYAVGTFDRTVFSQLDYYGFQKPEGVGHYCEVFTIYATTNLEASIFEIEKIFLKPFCYEYAKEQGATQLLATCSKAMLTLYKRWGWDVLDTKSIEGEERFFIQLTL